MERLDCATSRIDALTLRSLPEQSTKLTADARGSSGFDVERMQ
jgi:hypothetical protein